MNLIDEAEYGRKGGYNTDREELNQMASSLKKKRSCDTCRHNATWKCDECIRNPLASRYKYSKRKEDNYEDM